MTRLWAQEFTYVDWNILRPDTLPVQYTEVIPLDEDYRSFRYEVRLDYPEYVRLTATEAERVAVWGKDLPENPDVYCQVAVSRKKGVWMWLLSLSYGVEGNIISWRVSK